MSDKTSCSQEYQQSLFQELRAEDELVILARGLGLMRLLTNLLHSYDAAGGNLIVIVNAEDRENNWIGEALAEHAAISMAPLARGLTVVNTDYTNVGAREKMYASGGIFSVTSRILVVDLLTNLLNVEKITGVVVLHADRVVATSLEAFILRIYRQKNKVGFLKAFSDNPDPFTTGFNPLASMMRNLFLRKASLWPRFHVSVGKSLEGKKQAEVIELEVPMTDSMKAIQSAVMECVEVSIHELKKGSTGLDMEDWTLDSALTKNFDVIIRRQLDPNWHRVSWKTKQIVGDLTVLRGLLQSVVAYDAVAFLQNLDTIHAAHSPAPGSTRQTQSPWLFLDAAQTIFDTAKKRVYRGVNKPDSDSNIDSLRPVLEEQPKWSVLAEVLEEIDRDLYFEPRTRDDSNGTILIMCSDTATCRQLRDFLQTMHVKVKTEQQRKKIVYEGGDEDDDRPSATFMMRRRLREYLKWKKEFAQVSATLFSENQNALKGATDPRLQKGSRAPANKRRRVRGGGSTGANIGRAENGSLMPYFEKAHEVAELMEEVQATEEDAKQKVDMIAQADPLEDMDDFYQLYDMQDLVVIHAYDSDQDEHILEEVRPRYIIMYEPDASFIRRVEVYRSSHNDRNVRVYFLYYGGSVEEQRYLSSVRREKDAFTKLIKERASMSVVMTVDAHGVEDPQEAFLRTVNTRIAGGGRLAATAQPPRIVVDVREFNSSLPSLLHARSIVIVPCMITVGDYILSPNICVERKSVSDLISSFRDGRLYSQCERMFQFYKSPMLLIEFDQNKSFTLEPFADLSGTLNSVNPANVSSDLQSKLVLLTLAFPKLRIIWSSSPYQTAEIFESLKAQEEEPDPIAAVRAGLEKDQDGDAAAGEQSFNQQPEEMLMHVPGVTGKNVRNITLKAENIREVANLTTDELETMVGVEAGRKIAGFFEKDLLEDDD